MSPLFILFTELYHEVSAYIVMDADFKTKSEVVTGIHST